VRVERCRSPWASYRLSKQSVPASATVSGETNGLNKAPYA